MVTEEVMEGARVAAGKVEGIRVAAGGSPAAQRIQSLRMKSHTTNLTSSDSY